MKKKYVEVSFRQYVSLIEHQTHKMSTELVNEISNSGDLQNVDQTISDNQELHSMVMEDVKESHIEPDVQKLDTQDEKEELPNETPFTQTNDGEDVNNAVPLPAESIGPENNDDFLDTILKEAEKKEPEHSTEGSSSDSSQDSSSEEDNSDSSSEGENVELDAGVAGESDGEDDNSGKPITSKNEILDEPAPAFPEDFKINESDPIEEIGTITSIVEKSIIIKGHISGEFRFLKEESVLCLEDKVPLGYLFEIFGPLAHPLYRIKFNSDAALKKFEGLEGRKVFYVVPKSNFIYTDSIKALKGSDASNWNDEEIAEDEQEFSDDEKEMESKKSKNKKKRNRKSKEESQKDEQTHSLPNKVPNRQRQERNNQKRFQHQVNYPRVPQQETNLSFGYQSRSQREQQPTQSYAQTPAYYQVPPTMFQPPPQMASPFPFPPQVPVPAFPPNMNPQQWQQFYQMQQMMMQQMYAAQQSNQFPPQGPPDSSGPSTQ